MLTVGDSLPSFSLLTVAGGALSRDFVSTTEKSYPGKWLVLFAWPKDFTFVCPTEIAEFGKKAKDFADRDAQVLGFSTDTEFVHHAWRTHHEDLKDLAIPMLADTKRELSLGLGILHQGAGVPLRATFIVDPEGIIRWVSVNDLSVGRNVGEVLRTLDALQTDELCPCNWQKGDAPLKVGLAMAALSEILDAFPAAAKDVKLNVSGVLSSGSLEEADRYAVAVACAYAENDAAFAQALVAEAGAKISEGHVEDAKTAAALMGMTNIFYRFRHLVGKETYKDKPPRLRMNGMASPKTDKRTFELLSLAVSIIGGCEDCVRSHEKVVRDAGMSEDQVNDAARIAATIHAAARVKSWG